MSTKLSPTRRTLQKPTQGDTLLGCLVRLYGKSVDEIANELKVSRTAVLSWANGSNVPREAHAKKLSALFGHLSVSALLQPADPSKLVLLLNPTNAKCKCGRTIRI